MNTSPRIVTVLTHRWYVLDKPSNLGPDYVLLRRVAWMGELKRRGQVSVEIDFLRKELFSV